ncbi:MAG: metal-sensitive transcriptional regulator [candidate division NC10 bacterium]|nr:metal-sensitive transcriptional regulator [candidate division NC10 bacterium]MBI2561782.1 metal-sensitive transcriptional regulator [candidate division NC10 bacterium]
MPGKKTSVPRTSQAKTALLSRLRTIEGHVRGILRMVEADAYCPEILTQALAVQRAIDRFSFELLEHHLETCFVSAVRGDSQQNREEALRELLNIFQTSAKLKTARHHQAVEGDDDLPAHLSTSKAGRSGLAAQGIEGR